MPSIHRTKNAGHTFRIFCYTFSICLLTYYSESYSCFQMSRIRINNTQSISLLLPFYLILLSQQFHRSHLLLSYTRITSKRDDFQFITSLWYSHTPSIDGPIFAYCKTKIGGIEAFPVDPASYYKNPLLPVAWHHICIQYLFQSH